MLNRQLPVNSKEVLNYQFQCLKSSVLLKCFFWNQYMLLTLERSRPTSFFFKKHFRYEIWSWGIQNCFSIFPRTVKDRVMKFSENIDLWIEVCNYWLSMSAVTSGRHRKWKKKSKFTKLIFQIEFCTTLLDLISSVQYIWPHRVLNRQLPVNSKEVLNYQFQCLKSSVQLKCFIWN